MATLTITLPDDLAATLRARVAAGDYPDEGAVIAELLRDLDEPPEVTDWLQREVPKRLAALNSGMEPLFSSNELRAQLAEWRGAGR